MVDNVFTWKKYQPSFCCFFFFEFFFFKFFFCIYRFLMLDPVPQLKRVFFCLPMLWCMFDIIVQIWRHIMLGGIVNHTISTSSQEAQDKRKQLKKIEKFSCMTLAQLLLLYKSCTHLTHFTMLDTIFL